MTPTDRDSLREHALSMRDREKRDTHTTDPDWRDTRTAAGRQADMDRGAAAERLRIEAMLNGFIAEKQLQLAKLYREIADLQRQMAEEMARA